VSRFRPRDPTRSEKRVDSTVRGGIVATMKTGGQAMKASDVDHFARPVGGMVVTKPPFVCAVCGRPIERTGVRRSNRNWKHITKEATR
jgi:uncharacterized protein YgbK (DUF1537 family)